MKKLLLFSFLFLLAGFSFAQGENEWAAVSNPQFQAFGRSDVVMKDNQLYQVYDSLGYNVLKVSVYSQATGNWKVIGRLTGLTSTVSSIQTELVGDKIYIVTQGYDAFTLFVFDLSNYTFQQIGTPISSPIPASNWNFRAGDSNSELLVLRVDNYDNVYLSKYNPGSGSWDSYDYSTFLNPTGSDVSAQRTELYLTTGGAIYCGISGTTNRLGVTTIANPTAINAYNSTGSNNGIIQLDGAESSNVVFYLTGDGQNAPMLNLREGTLLKTWQAVVTTNDINILSGVTTPLDFNVTANAYTTIFQPNFTYVVSNFTPMGGGPTNNFYVYHQDIASQIWDSLPPKIEAGFPALLGDKLRAAYDPVRSRMAVQYATQATSGSTVIRVRNALPYTETAPTLNGGLCLGHHNELYPRLELFDEDSEHLRISTITSLNGSITNLSAIPMGEDVGANPSVSKFRIYGTPSAAVADAVIITYTDGWSIVTDTLPTFTVTDFAPNIVFNQSPLFLCSNENLIELENYVNFTGNGIFTFNGQELTSSTINGITESVQNPNGTIYYEVNVDGCFVETGVSFSFVNAGTATATTTDATCGSADGIAEITFINGTSPNVTFEWSTGETTAIIENLTAGAYYYAVTDEYGCHTTGFAGVAAAGMDVSVTPVPMTCPGANNASLEVNVTGVADYSVLWSNGYSTNLISNLAAGTYEVTVTTTDCQATYSYQVADIPPITATLTVQNEPGCGQSDGAVNGTYGGGTGTLTYNWLGQGQTTPNLTGVPYDFYEVIVTDGNGCLDIFGIQLNNFQSVSIADSIIPTNCQQSTGAILTTLTPHPTGNPPSSISWSNGNPFEDNFNLEAGAYAITVACLPVTGTDLCYSSKKFTVGTRAPLRQEICLVTVDTNTSSNQVVWEKIETDIDHYNIYRENAIAGLYMQIDTVMYGSESVFNDVVASPIDRSWRYRISAVNACGVEGPISNPHKTVHLNSILVQGNGSMDIFWDDYEGLTAPEYVVWRHTDAIGWEALSPSVPFGTSVYNNMPPAGATGLDYFVELVPGSCTAEKVQDFNSSRSNKDKGQFKPGEGSGDSNNSIEELSGGTVEVYPNPFEDQLTVAITNATTAVDLSIYSISGQHLLTVTLANGTHQLDLHGLGAGVYFVKAGKINQLQRFIKH